MEKKRVDSYGLKYQIIENGKEVARTYLYVMNNDLHAEPFGLMEDVFVSEEYRRKGYGEQLVKAIISEAKRIGCYKLICNCSKEWIQEWYIRLGFKNRGIELRIDL